MRVNNHNIKVQEYCAESLVRNSDKSEYGMYSHSDAPAAIGGGFGAFQWLSNYDNN